MAKKKKAKRTPEPPPLPEEVIRQAMAQMGRKGGKAGGLRKARTSEQASAAAKVRWAKVKRDQPSPPDKD